ncbi:hypothetical protein AAF712_016821, partial [Marasmius tenuissimus]
RREGNMKARNILLVAITLTFAISSFEFWTNVVVVLTGVKNVFVDNVGTSFIWKQAVFGKKFTLLTSVQEVFNPLEV